jgi:hypothetical protein
MRFALLLLLCLVGAAAPAFVSVPAAIAQDAAEIAFWESVRDSKNPAELQAYLDAYPNGAYAALAKIRIGTLGGTVTTAPAPEPAPAPATTTTTTAPAATSGPQMMPAKPVYPPFEQVTINWSGIPTSLQSGWIALFRQGETQEVTRASVNFTDKTGSTVFEGQLPGTYEVRLLTPPYGSEYVLAKAGFTVAEPGTAEAGEGATLTPASATVMPFEPIELRWANIPTSMQSGWIKMKRADGTEVAQVSISPYTEKSGTSTFDGTLPGEYSFELLSPPYGSELVLATARVTVVDPTAAQTTPPPAPQPEETAAAADTGTTTAQAGGEAAGTTTGATTDTGSGGRTAAQTQAADAGTATPPAPAGVERSTLGQIAFPDRPQPGDPNLGPMLLEAIKDTVPVSCTGPTESYSWTVAAEEDARLQQLLNNAAVGLRDSGYQIAQIPSDLSNALFYKATGPNDSLLMMFILEEEIGLLGMVLCPTE